jgi:hypothetical protein
LCTRCGIGDAVRIGVSLDLTERCSVEGVGVGSAKQTDIGQVDFGVANVSHPESYAEPGRTVVTELNGKPQSANHSRIGLMTNLTKLPGSVLQHADSVNSQLTSGKAVGIAGKTIGAAGEIYLQGWSGAVIPERLRIGRSISEKRRRIGKDISENRTCSAYRNAPSARIR